MIRELVCFVRELSDLIRELDTGDVSYGSNLAPVRVLMGFIRAFDVRIRECHTGAVVIRELADSRTGAMKLPYDTPVSKPSERVLPTPVSRTRMTWTVWRTRTATPMTPYGSRMAACDPCDGIDSITKEATEMRKEKECAEKR